MDLVRLMFNRTAFWRVGLGLGVLGFAAFGFGQAGFGQGSFGRVEPLVDPFKNVPKSGYAADHVVVSFQPGAEGAVRQSVARRYGLELDRRRSSPYFVVLRIPRAALAGGFGPLAAVRALMSEPSVRWAELDPVLEPDFVPNDPRFGEMWGLHNTGQSGGTVDADIDAVEAWALTGSAPDAVVAVCDDGVDLSHPDLSANIWVNTGEIAGNGVDDDGNGFIDDRVGWDFSNGDNNPNPASGDSHGTHVAGTIGARVNNAVGVAGVARNVKIMPIRMYGGPANFMTALAQGVDYAWRNGATVISVSYNIDSYTNALVEAILRARAADVIYSNSAGNNNQLNPPRMAIRNLADNVIFVASSTRTDSRSSFSNYGTRIEIFAPGSDILSTLPGNSYGLNSGTSMATPHVSGVLGVVRAMRPTLTARQTLDLVIGTADQVAGLSSFVPGGRRLNYRNALEQDSTPPGAVTGLMLTRRANTAAEFTMVTTGDDGNVGRADYDVRLSGAPINGSNFGSARRVEAGVPSEVAGTTVRFAVSGLWPGQETYLAVQALDNLGNRGPVASFGPFRTRGGHWGDRVEDAAQFSGASPWAVTTVQSFSGARSWTDSPSGNYANNANVALTQSAAVVLPGTAALRFMGRVDLETNRDFLAVEVQVNGGSWQRLGRLTGLSDWRGYSFPLPSGSGDAVRVRFVLTSDGSVSRDGVYLDDITIVPTVQVYSDDVEGPDRFAGVSPWARTAAAGNGGGFGWEDSPGGNYANNRDVSLTGNLDIDVRSLASPLLTFQSRFDLETGYDYLFVESSGNSGSSWTSLGSLNGTQATWAGFGFALPASDFVRLRFRLDTDGSVVRDGVYLDNFAISGELWEAMAPVSGRLELPGYVGDPAARPISLRVVDRASGNTLEVLPVTWDASTGDYWCMAPARSGVDLWFDTVSYRRQRYLNQNLTSGLSGFDVRLFPGDVNDDHVVSLTDVQIVRAALPSLPGQARWNPLADINGDGTVSTLDLQLVFNHLLLPRN